MLGTIGALAFTAVMSVQGIGPFVANHVGCAPPPPPVTLTYSVTDLGYTAYAANGQRWNAQAFSITVVASPQRGTVRVIEYGKWTGPELVADGRTYYVFVPNLTQYGFTDWKTIALTWTDTANPGQPAQLHDNVAPAHNYTPARAPRYGEYTAATSNPI